MCQAPRMLLLTILGLLPVFARCFTLKFESKINHIQPPHIIFLLADDLGWNDVGYHGKAGSLINTPFIDKLARKGVRLENYYVQPVCSPTRIQLMTGRYQIRMGLQQAKFCPGEVLCLPLNEKLLPEKLKELGYATHAVGKWHLGMSRRACLPTQRGFDSFFGILLGTSHHFTFERMFRINGRQYVGNALFENENATNKYRGQFCTNAYAKRAVEIIKKHDKNKPLFLYVPFQMVHEPDDVPSKFRHMYKNISSLQRRFYAGRVAALDEAVRNITRALRIRGLYQNSVIIFSTDNGGAVESSASNWPLRGSKGTLWEGGIRGVAFVHSELLPVFVRGRINKELMHVTDWLPTLVKGVAGGNLSMPHKLDGFNQWQSIRAFRPSPRKVILHELNTRRDASPWGKRDRRIWGKLKKLPFNATIRASIREGNWKLITGKAGYSHPSLPSESHLHKTYKRRNKHSVAIRLYDVSKDPAEKRNIAHYEKRKVKRLLLKLKKFQKQTKEPLRGKIDERCDPARFGGAWSPWLTDAKEQDSKTSHSLTDAKQQASKTSPSLTNAKEQG